MPCYQDQQVAMLSIIINNKTLEAVKYVSCNLTVTTDGELRDISSSRAYIVDIKNPYHLLTKPCPQCSEAIECPNTSRAQKEQLTITQIIVIIFINFFIVKAN